MQFTYYKYRKGDLLVLKVLSKVNVLNKEHLAWKLHCELSKTSLLLCAGFVVYFSVLRDKTHAHIICLNYIFYRKYLQSDLLISFTVKFMKFLPTYGCVDASQINIKMQRFAFF